MSAKGVHVDWHMTPDEWEELRGVLLRNTGYEYIGRLEAAGLLTAAPKRQHDASAASDIGKALQLAVVFAWLAYMAYLIAGLVT